MEYRPGAGSNLKSAFTTLELLTTVYESVLPTTGAFAGVLAVEYELETRFLVRKVALETH